MALHWKRQEANDSIMDADYIDDIALLANTPAQSTPLLDELQVV